MAQILSQLTWECTRGASFTLFVFFFEQVCRLFYSRFILLLSLFYPDHLVSINSNHEFYDDVIMSLFLFPILLFCKFEFYL